MAIVLEANYAKKLGLPGYSSHQYSVSIRTELTDVSQVETESSRLYRLLQDAVDREIQEVGFIPESANYGKARRVSRYSTNGNTDHSRQKSHAVVTPRTSASDSWRCSDKQRQLIENLVREHSLDKSEIEALAQDRFGAGVRQLDKLQASGLIDEIFERYCSGNGHVVPAAVNSNGIASKGAHLFESADKVRAVSRLGRGGESP